MTTGSPVSKPHRPILSPRTSVRTTGGVLCILAMAVRTTGGVLCILAMAALAAGCGQNATATPMPTATTPPSTSTQTVTPAPAPTAEAAPAPTAPPTATPPPTEAAPPPAPTPTAPAPTRPAPAATPALLVAEAHPSDAYFALDRVLDISIEIAPEDWDTLRHQTRTFEDLLEEIEEYELSRPFASIYTWFSGRVTVDGETHADVGVRKKGFLGSQSDTKPSLKLRFDKYVDDQTLGGVIERMTLNNSIQDPSLINTCLAYQIFAAAGLPASRCSFATVTVNGNNLGPYVHVEEIKPPFLRRHFASAEGILYEGTISDFTPDYRGTFEKKTNEDADDWSDVDAVLAALQDPSDAGLKALADIVDLDRFLTFWATESLVGHWDGYTGDRNNYHFYREPDGKFVFIPWGLDDTFHLKDDPNPFDNISNPPPSVLALTAIPNGLYNNDDWRAKYAVRLKELLNTVWKEEELLASVDEMAAIVQQYALPEVRDAAAADTERVRKFILKRKGEILADITPEPPDWPEPSQAAVSLSESDLEAFEVRFETTWGSHQSANPLAEGKVYELNENGEWVATSEGDAGATAGPASPQEAADIGVEDAALITVMGLYRDFTVQGFTFWLPVERLPSGAKLSIGVDAGVGGVIWQIPPGKTEPEGFIPITAGGIELTEAGTEPGASVAGRVHASWGSGPPPGDGDAGGEGDTSGAPSAGLVINEVAAQGEPLDWFELYNASDSYLALANFVVADDLSDASKRVAFPADLVIPPGEHRQVQLDKDGWPGFALGKDEELGVWTADGILAAKVDWAEGQADAGTSYSRVPDVTGDFLTVSSVTPGAPNQAK